MANHPRLRIAVLVVLTAGIIAMGGTLLFSSSWAILIAAIAAATAGALLEGGKA